MDLLKHLNWRYATKVMNGQKVSDEKIDYILEAIRMAPTSSGLQQFEVFVVKSDELKEKIKPIANNQSVITECSHLLIFAAWDNYTEDRLNFTFENMQNIRGFSKRWDEYRKRLIERYVSRPKEQNFNHTARQSYIPFSFAIMAAAEQKVDATPIEGFNPAALDELLGFNEKGLKSTTLLTLGYRDEQNDWSLTMKKVRKSKTDLITVLD